MKVDGRSFAAGQAFLLTTKTWWTRELFPAVRNSFKKDSFERNPEYLYFCWLERHLQRFKYSGRYGLQPYHAQDRERLEASLASSPAELKPGFQQPEYYTRVDIHQHPGGVWSDPVAGFVYERGARSTTPLAGSKHKDLHERLTAAALERVPAPARVLDMGCGFGKSTRPFVEALGAERVEGIDLSAPCLRLAAKELPARFRQMDAAKTDYPDASFDLVTSTMLLHELPPEAVERTLAEAKRVLKPGGKMVHLDFLPPADPFLRMVHFGHARRNNEPYMEPLAGMDLPGVMKKLGLKNIEITPFEEAEGTLAPDYPYWRFPWVLVAAES